MAEKKSLFSNSSLFFIISILLLAAVIVFRLLPGKEIPAELQAVMRPLPVTLQPFPDICPTTLTTLAQMVKKLDANANADLQVIFVSVDPARDQPEKMAKYLNYFNPNFIGLSADKETIDKFTRQFAAGYMLEDKKDDGSYLVAHTSSIFLIDPEARLIASFSPPHQLDTLVSQYRLIKEI